MLPLMPPPPSSPPYTVAPLVDVYVDRPGRAIDARFTITSGTVGVMVSAKSPAKISCRDACPPLNGMPQTNSRSTEYPAEFGLDRLTRQFPIQPTAGDRTRQRP